MSDKQEKQIKELERQLKLTEEILEFAYAELSDITSDQFSKGADKPTRERIEEYFDNEYFDNEYTEDEQNG